ncbi:PD-(D/E)XK nuclease family protein [Sulfurimonas sp. SAG-AH-194-C20]|nr:PD-(D/E)XK nuclease family protein [Sulfurimonas sp. SAG-AH-194-C20]MDF1878405.1 PD-(D/E)XK nuclease family protein [Sulfurimonas sp. SAG-AH-194-C20]
MADLSMLESLDKTKKSLSQWKNNKNIQRLKEFYEKKSFSSILGVDRREMSHSKFLAWILNDVESHNMGDFAIRQLFDILLKYGESKFRTSLERYNDNNATSLIFDDLYRTLLLNTYILNDLEVSVEKNLTAGRIDIIISLSIHSTNSDTLLAEKINIIIENKVDSSEHSNQTNTYYDYYTNDEKYKNNLNLFVYLAPVLTSEIEKLKEDESLAEAKEFISINYQLLVDNIFERALEHDISDRIKFIIEEYLLSLCKPSKNQNKGKRMAILPFEKNLVKEFWEQEQEFLLSVFQVIAEIEEDPVSANELREISNKMSNNLVRYPNISEYIKNVIPNIAKDNKANLSDLIKAIERKFGDSIEITYAPSKINIKKLFSNSKKKVFVYISVSNAKFLLNFLPYNKEKIKTINNNDFNIESIMNDFQVEMDKI